MSTTKFRCKVDEMQRGFSMWILLVLLVSCGNKGADKVTREDCSKVADHIAKVMIDEFVKRPDDLWDLVHAKPGDTGLPQTVTKPTFGAFLATPEGKTWLMKRQADARSGTERGIDQCLAKAKRKDVDCLLAAKTRDDVTACDKPAAK